MLTTVLDQGIIPLPAFVNAQRPETVPDSVLLDYHVACPHGILAGASMLAAVIASPRRLSTRDGGQNAGKHKTRPPLHAGKRPMVASQSVARDLVAASAPRRQAA